MKIKSELRKHCPQCNTHTMHKVSVYKRGQARPLAEGSRRMDRKTKGYGSFPKPIQKRFAKTTKKTMLQYECKECGYTFQSDGIRLKKVEIQRI